MILSISAPVYAFSISEVAWMGAPTSANHEWIELYNPGEVVNVDGWTLTDGMNLNINLTGTIPASSYVVLERNRSDGGSVVGTPFLNYTGALVNTGATLTLRRADNSIVDQVVGGENWVNIGGDNTTKETAQYTNNGWVTASPTPGAPNATVSSSPSPVSSTPITSSSNTVINNTAKAEITTRARYTHLPWELDMAIHAPATAQVNQPVIFRSTATGLGPTHLESLVYNWNFGDLSTGGGSKATNTYAYPGTYIVTLYATFAKREAVAQHTINILPVQFSLARVTGGDLQLYNDAPYDVDISGFVLKSGGKTIVFPPRSYLTARSTLTIPASRIGNPLPVTLFDQHGNQLASTVATHVASNSEPSYAPLISVAPTANTSQTTVNQPATEVTNQPTTNQAFRFATAEASANIDFLSTEQTSEDSEEENIILTSDIIDNSPPTDPSTTAQPNPSSNNNIWYAFLVIILTVGILALIFTPRRPT